MPFVYPEVRRDPVVDDYHGTSVPDPYRWLEDPGNAEVDAFIEAQNVLTTAYLDGLPETQNLQVRVAELWNVVRAGAPDRRAGTTVWTESDGSTDQPRWMVETPQGDRKILLDPNQLSDDGAVAVVNATLSPDGRLWAYSLADGGSDWQVVKVRDTATLEDLDDDLRFVKFTSIAWWEDGFFYGRFPAQSPDSVEPSRNQAVMFHRLGTRQDDDELWFDNPADPDLGYDPFVTHDGQLLVLTEWSGTSLENGLLVSPLPGEAGRPTWSRVVDHSVGVHDVLERLGEALLVLTDVDAPNKRIVLLPLDGTSPSTVVPESDTVIERSALSAQGIVVVRVSDGCHTVEVRTEAGNVEHLDLPGHGTVTSLAAAVTEHDILINYESFVQCPAVFERDGDGLARWAGQSAPIDLQSVDVRRLHATSTDGARVPMWVFSAAGPEGPTPVELYGYGGFSIPVTPMYNPARLAFLEAGGSVALANLRGGIEYGEAWHRAGMLGSKQQVFDDFIACATALVDSAVATHGSVGASGRSNGGLLTAACMVQRPDLFGAVVSQVPVTDMLRYQHFTAGRYWTVEYGDSSDPEAFRWLHAYSPYHRVVEDGIDPPPLLVTTGVGDDRVVPMHSFKLVAAVQHAVGGSSAVPVLLRVDTRAGHGLGKPLSKLIAESAHVYAFLLHHLSAHL